MATPMHALATFRPRPLARRTIDHAELARRMARGSVVSPALCRYVLDELAAEIGRALDRGEAVTLEGIATIGFSARLDGRVRRVARLAPRLQRNVPAAEFAGRWTNRDAIGATVEALVARWNAAHPDDPVAATAPDAAPGAPQAGTRPVRWARADRPVG